jgi:hypothetical protein
MSGCRRGAAARGNGVSLVELGSYKKEKQRGSDWGAASRGAFISWWRRCERDHASSSPFRPSPIQLVKGAGQLPLLLSRNLVDQ